MLNAVVGTFYVAKLQQSPKPVYLTGLTLQIGFGEIAVARELASMAAFGTAMTREAT